MLQVPSWIWRPLSAAFFTEAGEIGVFKIFERVEVSDEKRIGFQLRGVVDERIGFPFHGADSEVIEAEFYFARFLSERGWGGGESGGGGDASFEKGATGQVCLL